MAFDSPGRVNSKTQLILCFIDDISSSSGDGIGSNEDIDGRWPMKMRKLEFYLGFYSWIVDSELFIIVFFFFIVLVYNIFTFWYIIYALPFFFLCYLNIFIHICQSDYSYDTKIAPFCFCIGAISLQASFQHISRLANEMTDCPAKQRVNRSCNPSSPAM